MTQKHNLGRIVEETVVEHVLVNGHEEAIHIATGSNFPRPDILVDHMVRLSIAERIPGQENKSALMKCTLGLDRYLHRQLPGYDRPYIGSTKYGRTWYNKLPLIVSCTNSIPSKLTIKPGIMCLFDRFPETLFSLPTGDDLVLVYSSKSHPKFVAAVERIRKDLELQARIAEEMRLKRLK